MYGFFQTSFYFGYMALFSLALGIMCGKPFHFTYKFSDPHISNEWTVIGASGERDWLFVAAKQVIQGKKKKKLMAAALTPLPFLFAGTLGYVGTNQFVRKIYSTVKID